MFFLLHLCRTTARNNSISVGKEAVVSLQYHVQYYFHYHFACYSYCYSIKCCLFAFTPQTFYFRLYIYLFCCFITLTVISEQSGAKVLSYLIRTAKMTDSIQWLYLNEAKKLYFFSKCFREVTKVIALVK